MKTHTTFTIQDYIGEFNLLKQEKKLIIKALAKTHGNIKGAHKLLCPQLKPQYSLSFLQTQIKRHEISIAELRDGLKLSENERNVKRLESQEHHKLVKENFKKFEQKYGFKLRSAE